MANSDKTHDQTENEWIIVTLKVRKAFLWKNKCYWWWRLLSLKLFEFASSSDCPTHPPSFRHWCWCIVVVVAVLFLLIYSFWNYCQFDKNLWNWVSFLHSSGWRFLPWCARGTKLSFHWGPIDLPFQTENMSTILKLVRQAIHTDIDTHTD